MEEKVETKNEQPKLKRVGSDSRFDNKAYQEKQEKAMIAGLIQTMGLSGEEAAELQAELRDEK